MKLLFFPDSNGLKSTGRELSPSRFRALLMTMNLVLASFIPSDANGAQADPPDLMSYQGFLVDADGLPLAPLTPENYPIKFDIFDQNQGGTALWTENQTVTVDNGNFSVILGEAGGNLSRTLSSVFADSSASDRFIGITVTIDGTATPIEPRLRFVPSAYSFLSANARGLVAPDGINTVHVLNGAVGILTAAPMAELDVNGDVRADGFIGSGAGLTGLAPGQIPNLSASKITSDTLNVARIPDLNASKIATGTLNSDRIPGLDASKITAGIISSDRLPGLTSTTIPNLDASKITSGVFAQARIPNFSAGKITSGTLDNSRLPSSINTTRLVATHMGVGLASPNINYGIHIRNSSLPSIGLQVGGGHVWQIFANGTAGDLRIQRNDKNVGFHIGPNGVGAAGSDRSKKKDIDELENLLPKVLRLRPVDYRFLDEGIGEEKSIGFIAQEVEELFPEVVFGEEGDKSVAYASMVPIVAGAIKELNEQLNRQKAQIQELTRKAEEADQAEALLGLLHRQVEAQQKTIDALLIRDRASAERLASVERMLDEALGSDENLTAALQK